MGLTIHYRLRFDGSPEEALTKISQLREKAMGMSFEEVSDVRHFTGADCNFNADKYDNNSADSEWRWALIQSNGRNIRITSDGKRLKKNEKSSVGCYHISPQPIEIILFRTWPGEGCEEANFGLARYKRYIYFRGQKVLSGLGTGWHWVSFCKTQYANEKGLLNFLRCHTLVVAMLDCAKELGIMKSVDDEGKYWEKRDMKDLAEEVGRWDELIAGFSAMLGKAVGEQNLVSEIKNHPRYEKLKNIGMQHLNEHGVAQLKELFEADQKKAKEVDSKPMQPALPGLS